MFIFIWQLIFFLKIIEITNVCQWENNIKVSHILNGRGFFLFLKQMWAVWNSKVGFSIDSKSTEKRYLF